MFIDLRLPDLGLTGQPITLSSWLVRLGTDVEEGEAVAEILAGPAAVELPSPVRGRLVKKLAETDQPLSEGQILAVIESGDEA